MIVIGNTELALGMKFCGVRTSYSPKDREEVLSILEHLPKNELIIANAKFINMAPELKEFPNLASLPDDIGGFEGISDLKEIVRSAIGVELEDI
jgi:vacuolar-type H+-ATPase subunit F/Vma7